MADDFCDRCGKHHTPSCVEQEWADYQRRNPGPPRRVGVMARFPIRDFAGAAAAAAEGPTRFVRCDAVNADGVQCYYGRDHSIEHHSWDSTAPSLRAEAAS